jgi:hypothetical protein
VCLQQSLPTDRFLAWLDRIGQQQLDGPERAIRRVLWTDPAHWMKRVIPLDAPYRYR